MVPTTRSRGSDIDLTVSRLFAQAFHAYLECDASIQQVIKDMVAIIHDPETDADGPAMAEATIREVLFPLPTRHRRLSRRRPGGEEDGLTRRSAPWQWIVKNPFLLRASNRC